MTQLPLRDAKDAWLEKFEGASIVKVTPIGSPTMRHLHKRSFGHVGRNCHFISVFGRILLGEDQISEAEAAVSKRIVEVTTGIERKISAMKAIVADRGLSDNLAQFNASSEIVSKIVVPSQTRFLNLIALGDQYLVLVNTALAYWAWMWGLRRLGTRTMGMLALVNPVVAVSLGVMLVNEQLAPLQWCGIATVLGSLVLMKLPLHRLFRRTPLPA